MQLDTRASRDLRGHLFRQVDAGDLLDCRLAKSPTVDSRQGSDIRIYIKIKFSARISVPVSLCQ